MLFSKKTNLTTLSHRLNQYPLNMLYFKNVERTNIDFQNSYFKIKIIKFLNINFSTTDFLLLSTTEPLIMLIKLVNCKPIQFLTRLVYVNHVNEQCSHHTETSQLISFANQLSGFYMMRTMAVKGLI